MNNTNQNVIQRKVAFIMEGVGFLEMFSTPILSVPGYQNRGKTPDGKQL